METNELKPCPFCGGKASTLQTSTGYSGGEFSASFEIGCNECKIRFRGTSYFVIKNGTPIVSVDGYKEAINLWNRRANDGT